MTATSTTLPTELLDWISTVAGGPVHSHHSHEASGRSRLIHVVECGDRRLLLRRETGLGPFGGTEFTLAREAGVLSALAGRGVPVPELVGLSPDGRTVLMELLPGTTDLGTDPRSILGRYCELLAELHALDVTALSMPLPLPTTSADHARLDLAMHDAAYRRCTPTRAADNVLGWLSRHQPTRSTATALQHGDAGPGNFLRDGQEITGLIDWELAHVGDPMDDLAWLWFRITVLGAGGTTDPAGDLQHAYDVYRARSGRVIDPELLTYYGMAVLARCLIATLTRNRNDPREHSHEPVERMSKLVTVALDGHRRTGGLLGMPEANSTGPDAPPGGSQQEERTS